MLERLTQQETAGESTTQGREGASGGQPSDRPHGQGQSHSGDDTAETGEESPTDSLAFRFGHLVLGGILAFMAFDNLRNLDGRIQYADAKDVPRPQITVPAASGLLQAGSVGVALWRLPTLSTAAVATFFAGVTPVMHDFWAQEDEDRQQQFLHFLKNTALFGAVLALFGLGRQSD